MTAPAVPGPIALPHVDGHLVHCVGDGMTARIEVKEGMHLKFPDGPFTTPAMLFQTTLAVSALLDGKPVRCKGFLPGISLRAEHRFVAGGGAVNGAVVKGLWCDFEPLLARWVDADPQMAYFPYSFRTGRLLVAKDQVASLDQGALDLEVVRAWGLQ
jgi:hypothetical protein